ncbi:hypothetical protein PanWU01x14_271380 [Parasponia andersonii]|uniref:Uncharacterized protein n=1 Tax=Parasponia andersonii TaxID=3476 RepID=A0A2P5B4P9_PARAD|nr:hypothetical protein PanWU01x14_271380 [Parasponia andersonii]
MVIQQFIPDSTHRLCDCYLGNNVSRNVKDPLFEYGFVDFMYNYYTNEEFDRKWAALLEKFDLTENK